MRGTRIPTPPVLAALVRAWNGDETEWLKRRTETEQEIAEAEVQPEGATKPVKPAKPANVAPPALAQMPEAQEVAGIDDDRSQRLKEWDLIERQVAAEGPRGQVVRDVGPPWTQMYRTITGTNDPIPFDMPLEQILLPWIIHDEARGTRELKEMWSALRREAGYPTLREIATDVKRSVMEVSWVLRGRGSPKVALETYMALMERALRLRSHDSPRASG
jgi:hypothetical protein